MSIRMLTISPGTSRGHKCPLGNRVFRTMEIKFNLTTQHNNSGTEGESVTLFHIWVDTEFIALILGPHLENWGIL